MKVLPAIGVRLYHETLWFLNYIPADLYYDIESNIHQIDGKIQNGDVLAVKKFLATENERIRTDLLQMNPAELKMASSVLTKSILLSRDSN